jgi:hypothetical protein
MIELEMGHTVRETKMYEHKDDMGSAKGQKSKGKSVK